MKQAVLISLLALLLAPVAARASVEEGRTRVTPWSGDWWSMRRGRMCNGYRDDMSPMRKHDRVTGAHASDWEHRNHYDPDYPKWYGHCHAWAAAAISEVEPTHRIRYKDITFQVGDIKAMLTEGHYGDKATVFGERNTGSGCDFQDIYPDKLWKVMQDYIGEQKIPLLMDLDPTPQVWTYPVYGYRIEYEPSGDNHDLYNCEMTLFVTNTTVPPDYVGCLRLIKHYTFQVQMKNGAIVEGTGRWTGKSRQDHPDYAWYPAARGQENEELVFSLAQKLAEQASGSRDEESRAFSERVASMEDWDRQQGSHDVAPGHRSPSPAPGSPVVANPALPDRSVTRRHVARRTVRLSPRSTLAERPASARDRAGTARAHLRNSAPT